MKASRVVIIVIVSLGVCAGAFSSLEQTSYSSSIMANPKLKAAVLDELRELYKQDVSFGWYCSSVIIPPASSLEGLERIAPECEFARLYLRQRWWAQLFYTVTVRRSQIDLAFRKYDGKHRFVSQPLTTMKSYPAFLVWAECRIQSEEDACAALLTVLNSRGIGGRSVANFIACRDEHGTWTVGWKPDGCKEPELILETDNNGTVIGGIMR